MIMTVMVLLIMMIMMMFNQHSSDDDDGGGGGGDDDGDDDDDDGGDDNDGGLMKGLSRPDGVIGSRLFFYEIMPCTSPTIVRVWAAIDGNFSETGPAPAIVVRDNAHRSSVTWQSSAARIRWVRPILCRRRYRYRATRTAIDK